MRANVLVSTKDLSHEDWLKYRKLGLGGSDAGSVAGVNPWCSAMDVYLDKVGEKEPIEENEYMYWGTKLEDLIADEFSIRTGLKVQKRNAILQDPEHPFMLANVDRLIKDKEKGDGILEIKTTSEYAKDKWEDENVPDSYFLQLQHYLAVTGLGYGYLAVLIGGNKYKHFYIERDEKVIAALIELESNFWNENVLKKIPPAFDGSDGAENYLKTLYPKANDGSIIEINMPDVVEAFHQLVAAKEQIKSLEDNKKRLEQIIKNAMQENEVAYIEDKKVKWTNVTTCRLDTKKLKSEAPEIYEKYANETLSRRLSI